jgi:DNA-binding transcriptional MocR family regulator
LLEALERAMPAGISWTHAEGGFFSWLTIPGCDSTALTEIAVRSGVGIVPGSLFYPDGRGTENVRLSFSEVDESLIDEGVERLASLVA